MKFIVSAVLLVFLTHLSVASDIIVREGVTWFEVETAPESSDIQQIFSDQLPGGSSFAHSPRVITANSDSTLAAWFDRNSGSWRGTLRQIKPGAYWLVLPPSVPETELSLPGIEVRAGSVATDWGAKGWLIRQSGSGGISVSPSGTPKSSATYRVQEKADSTWRAGSGVYVQGAPQNNLASYIWVDLDSVSSGYGAKSAAVPLPPGGRITVPYIPDFSMPPWGTQEVD